jgi:hypothetical protein
VFSFSTSKLTSLRRYHVLCESFVTHLPEESCRDAQECLSLLFTWQKSPDFGEDLRAACKAQRRGSRELKLGPKAVNYETIGLVLAPNKPVASHERVEKRQSEQDSRWNATMRLQASLTLNSFSASSPQRLTV